MLETFAALFAIVVLGISGLTFLHIENNRPVHYVEEQEYMEVI